MVETGSAEPERDMDTLTASQIRTILGPQMAARAASNGNVYNQVRAGLLREAVGTLCAGASHKSIDRAYAAARARLEAVRS